MNMSDQQAVRAVALSEAVKVVHEQGPEAVLKTAKTFLDFLVGPVVAPKTSTAGADPAPVKEGKPSANTAGATKSAATSTAKPAAGKAAAAKPKKPTEEELAAAALEKANAEAAAEGEGEEPNTDPIEATAEGVAKAVKLLIEGDKRDDAIALLKKYKAASVSSMQKKSEDEIIEFVASANELLGLGGEPSLED
jgi:hypothetical protein